MHCSRAYFSSFFFSGIRISLKKEKKAVKVKTIYCLIVRQQLEIKFSCKVCKEDFVEQYLQLYLYLKANSFIKIQRNSHVNFARKILLNNTYNYSYIQMQIHS